MKQKRRIQSLEKKRSYVGYIFILPFMVGSLLIFFPMIIQVLLSSISIFNAAEAKFDYGAARLGYFQELFTKDAWFLQLYTNSTLSALVDFICILFFSFFVAVLLNREFKGRSFARVIFFLPVILVSGVVAQISSGNLANAAGSLESAVDLGAGSLVKLPNVGDLLSRNRLLEGPLMTVITAVTNRMEVMTTASGVQILLFLAGLHSISPAVYEAAAIEGCSGWEMFWKITLPMTSPIILLNSIYTLTETLTNVNNPVVAALLNLTTRQRFSESAARSVVYLLVVGLLVAVIFLLGRKLVFYRE